MITPEKLPSLFNSKKSLFAALLKRLKKLNKSYVDELIHSEHHKAFASISCLDCANCCKTTGPLFTDKDIERISKRLKLKATEFIDQYLRIDEDNDYVLKTVPCVFLDSDNYCSIYEFRPKACREYPHTDRENQQQIFNIMYENASICPAVYVILENINKKVHSS